MKATRSVIEPDVLIQAINLLQVLGFKLEITLQVCTLKKLTAEQFEIRQPRLSSAVSQV